MPEYLSLFNLHRSENNPICAGRFLSVARCSHQIYAVLYISYTILYKQYIIYIRLWSLFLGEAFLLSR